MIETAKQNPKYKQVFKPEVKFHLSRDSGVYKQAEVHTLDCVTSWKKQHETTGLYASKSGCGKAPTFKVVFRSTGGKGDKKEDELARLSVGTLMTHTHTKNI